MVRLLDKMLAPLRRRIQLMVTRAVLTLVDDTTGLQTVQARLLAGELLGMERFQQFGFTGVPGQGSEAIALSVGGSRSGAVVIAVDDRRDRPTGLAEGEACVYAAGGQARILVQPGGTVQIMASTSVTAATPTVEADGKIEAAETVGGTDFVLVDQRTLLGLIQAYNSHTHTLAGVGTTDPPGSQF